MKLENKQCKMSEEAMPGAHQLCEMLRTDKSVKTEARQYFPWTGGRGEWRGTAEEIWGFLWK